MKCCRLVKSDAAVRVIAEQKYVGRGGYKLEAALDHFAINATDLVCLDVGASTGGFTDVLLRRGAAKVYAIDVGRGLLHWRLRQDARVVVIERINARDLESFPEPVSLVVIDVSFISLEKVLPAVRHAAPEAEVVALFKPQFEVGRSEVGKGGIVRDPAAVEAALSRFRDSARDIGYAVEAEALSEVAGAEGNREIFVHLEPARS